MTESSFDRVAHQRIIDDYWQRIFREQDQARAQIQREHQIVVEQTRAAMDQQWFRPAGLTRGLIDTTTTATDLSTTLRLAGISSAPPSRDQSGVTIFKPY